MDADQLHAEFGPTTIELLQHLGEPTLESYQAFYVLAGLHIAQGGTVDAAEFVRLASVARESTSN